jgi:N-acetylglutamate synthase-like GNAT family acetyltransferase
MEGLTMDKEWNRDQFLISTDKKKINLEDTYQYIKKTYWGKTRTVSQMAKAIQHSLCFGVYEGEKQIGFARVITDHCLFAYLADVFIDDKFQDQGLGKWLIETILNAEQLQEVKTWMLLTNDAHGLYEKFGFELYEHPEKIMRLVKK